MKNFNHLDVDKILKLNEQGLSMREIARNLGLNKNTVSNVVVQYTNPALAEMRAEKEKIKRAKRYQDVKNYYDFNKVLFLLENRKTYNDIAKELRPDLYTVNIYYWKNTLNPGQILLLAKYDKKYAAKSFKEVKIERYFEYKETHNNEVLPFGNKKVG